ncbi:amidase signature enzyme [Apiospora arundinis]
MSEKAKLNQEASVSTASTATTIIHVDCKPYLLHDPVTNLGPSGQRPEFLPATYFDNDTFASDFTIERFQTRLDADDVWSQGFLSLKIYPSSDTSPTQTAVETKYPDGLSLGVLRGLRITPGPYVLHTVTGNLHPVSRLMADQSNAFIRGVMPQPSNKQFQWFEASDLIPVPSRLYTSFATNEKPLSGLRFGVKDNIDTAGLQTGNGSKDYRNLHPPKEATAPCIQRLLDAGAVMVGKVRCTQWCDGQDPLERLEEVTPTNPRGDGWQKPSSSSSGSASACASYPWLDFTVGSDTGGSIRHPAGVNGLFGIRPSLDAIDPSSALVCCREFDTVGVFTRSASVANAVTRVMMGNVKDVNRREVDTYDQIAGSEVRKKRFKLLYAIEPPSETPSQTPKFFPNPSDTYPESQTPTATPIFESFIARLESHLDVKRHEINLYDQWRNTRPDPESTDEDLAKYMASIYPNLVYGSMARDVIQPFIADFQRAYPDRGQPFIEPTTKARLDYGAGVSDKEMHHSRDSLDAFTSWVNNVLLPAPAPAATKPSRKEDAGDGPGQKEEDGKEEETIPLLVYPQAWGQPQYRDDVSRREPGKLFWEGFSVYSISYGSGCPDYVVPLGEVEFTSRMTGAKAYLPVAISLLVPKGMDDVLLGLIQELEEVGILREVSTGDRLFRQNT